jgi:hypothetical protein
MNKYSYATNNPLIFKDPLGTSNCLIHYVETQAAFAKAGVPQGGAAAGIAVCAEDIGTRGLQWVTPVGMPWLAENKAAAMRTTRRVISSTIRMILLHQYQPRPGGFPSLKHIAGDSVFLPDATNATAQYVSDLLNEHVQDASEYLFFPSCI